MLDQVFKNPPFVNEPIFWINKIGQCMMKNTSFWDLYWVQSKIKPFSEMHIALLTPSPIFPPPPPSPSAVMRVHEVDQSGCRLTLSAQASIIT